MSTIINPVSFEGPGLLSGKNNKIDLKPASKGTGVMFTSAETGESFNVNTDRVLDTTHCVVIGYPGFMVKVPEHLLATLALLNIKNLEVVVYGDEVPVGDGSGKVFYDLLKDNVNKYNATSIKHNLTKSLYYCLKHTSIMALPSDNFKVSYAVNYVNSPFKYSWYKWEVDKDSITDIISSRTFGYMKDLPVYQSKGLALGVTLDNTIGLNDDGTLTTELRFPNEPIRHKIFDIIGDLFLTGLTPYELNAHIIVIECGHYQHIELAKLIKQDLNI